VDFFLGDSRVFVDLVLGDSVFLALAALAFFGDVANFLGLVVVVFFVVGAFVVAFLGDLVVFLGDLAVVVVVDDFFELDVDLFFGDEGTVVEEPDVDVDVDVEDFFTVVFFLSFSTDPGISL